MLTKHHKFIYLTLVTFILMPFMAREASVRQYRVLSKSNPNRSTHSYDNFSNNKSELQEMQSGNIKYSQRVNRSRFKQHITIKEKVQYHAQEPNAK